jgi:rubrerythrin
VKTSDKAREMLRFDLDNENETVKNYRERVKQCEALGEYAIVEHLREILQQEQEHQIDLDTALGEDVPDVSKLYVKVVRRAKSGRSGDHASLKRRPRVSGPAQMSSETTSPERAMEVVIAAARVQPASTRAPMANDVRDPASAPAW